MKDNTDQINTEIQTNPKLEFVKALIVFVVAQAIFSLPGVIKFCEDNLELNAMDVRMIPVGGLLFFIFWRLMAEGVFKPYLKLFEAREAATIGSLDAANEIISEAKKLEAEYEDGVFNARKKAVSDKLLKLEEIKKENTAALSEAESKAAEITEQSRKNLEVKISELRSSLDSKVEELSGEVVEKIKIKPKLAA